MTTTGQPHSAPRGRDLIRCGDETEFGQGQPQPAQRGALPALVLHQGHHLRPRADGVPCPLQGPQVGGVDQLVVERDHVAGGGEGVQVGTGSGGADGHLPAHQGGALLGAGGQQAHGQPQGDPGLVGHPGQLPGADDPHAHGADDTRAFAA